MEHQAPASRGAAGSTAAAKPKPSADPVRGMAQNPRRSGGKVSEQGLSGAPGTADASPARPWRGEDQEGWRQGEANAGAKTTTAKALDVCGDAVERAEANR